MSLAAAKTPGKDTLFFVNPIIPCAPIWGSGLDWVKSYMPRIITRPVSTVATTTHHFSLYYYYSTTCLL
jgi:hypothetical protein